MNGGFTGWRRYERRSTRSSLRRGDFASAAVEGCYWHNAMRLMTSPDKIARKIVIADGNHRDAKKIIQSVIRWYQDIPGQRPSSMSTTTDPYGEISNDE